MVRFRFCGSNVSPNRNRLIRKRHLQILLVDSRQFRMNTNRQRFLRNRNRRNPKIHFFQIRRQRQRKHVASRKPVPRLFFSERVQFNQIAQNFFTNSERHNDRGKIQPNQQRGRPHDQLGQQTAFWKHVGHQKKQNQQCKTRKQNSKRKQTKPPRR